MGSDATSSHRGLMGSDANTNLPIASLAHVTRPVVGFR